MYQLEGVNEPATIAFITCSFAVVLVLLAPTFWHFRNGTNAGAGCLGFWIAVGNLVNGVNSLVWRRDAIDRAPVWCDVSVKVLLVYQIACLCSALSIARFVTRAMAPGKTERTSRETRRQYIIDCCMCFGVPALMIATHIVYQPNRYAIARGVGCSITYVVTWPSLLLWLIWPPIVAVVASAYAVCTIRRAWANRRQMFKLIQSSGTPTARFIRMMAMFCGYAFCSVPMTFFYLYVMIKNGGGYIPYSWSFIHGHGTTLANDHDFRVPTLVPLSQGPGLSDWFAVITGFIFAAFFAFSKESQTVYWKLLLLAGLGRVFPTISDRAKPNKPKAGRATEISLRTNYRSSPARSYSKTSFDATEEQSTRSAVSAPFEDVDATSLHVIRSDSENEVANTVRESNV